MIALGIDPSLSLTGVALVEMTAWNGQAQLLDAYTIKPKAGHPLAKRLFELYEDASRLIRELASLDYSQILVELPQTAMFKGGARSAATLPNYGCAVGVVLAAAWTSRPMGVPVLTPSATEWAIGLKRGAGGEAKEGRVLTWQAVSAAAIDPSKNKEQRAAIADAALLARWGLIRTLQDQANPRKESP